jgi:hypothetical protein
MVGVVINKTKMKKKTKSLELVDKRTIKLWCCEEKGNGISLLPRKKNPNETLHISDFLATTMVFAMSRA